MRRACKVTLNFATARKRRAICALLEAYRAAVNYYIQSIWEDRGGLDKATLGRLPDNHTRLSARYKSQALKQAIETVVATKKAAKAIGKPCSVPIFRGAAVLDAKFVSVEVGSGSFDLVVKLSSLCKGKRLCIPTKRTAVLNKWAGRPLAKIVQGCALTETAIVLWVELPELLPKVSGTALGIDIGMNKLMALSDGSFLGTEFKAVRQQVARKQAGSRSKQRAIKTRDNYIRQQVNRLPWQSLHTIAVEDLKDVKLGKSKKRSKAFRKAASPWTYQQVIEAIRQKAQENRVHFVTVPPAYTSQTCPICETVDKRNRQAENFKCIQCAYSEDADTVGSINVLKSACRSVGSVESPMLPKRLQIDLTI